MPKILGIISSVKAPEIDDRKVGCIEKYYPLCDRRFEAAFTPEMIARIFGTDHSGSMPKILAIIVRSCNKSLEVMLLSWQI